jgi:histidinol-phosphatase
VHPDLKLALELADLADSLSLPRFRALDARVETKPDLTPVTDVDRGIERVLRDRIERERPDAAVLGEELGSTGAESGERWIVDPIDGTKNFVRGIPIYGTLVALERDGDLVVGVASAPALARRWWARRGEGAWGADGRREANGRHRKRRLRVSAVGTVEDAVLSYASLRRLRDGVAELADRAWHARTFSDFWHHVLVAEGAVDVAVEPVVSPWDIAAVKVIVEEAGGRCTDLAGNPGIDGGSLVSSNGLLHDEVLRALA